MAVSDRHQAAASGAAAHARGHQLRYFCAKTKMCQFFPQGRCGKAERCPFAHGTLELQQVPDLRRTKLCPSIANGEVCANPFCGFAHERTQLRAIRLRDVCNSIEVSHVNSSDSEVSTSRVGHAQACAGAFIVGAQAAFGAEGTFAESAAAAQGDELPSMYPRAAVVQLATAQNECDDAMQPLAVQATYSQSSFQNATMSEGSDSTEASRGNQGRGKFRKTRMCKFFEAGKCQKGNACCFAHREEELLAPPDLRCTKMCPALIETGQCLTERCTFAHSPAELRMPAPESAAESARLQESADDGAAAEMKDAACITSFSSCRLRPQRRKCADLETVGLGVADRFGSSSTVASDASASTVASASDLHSGGYSSPGEWPLSPPTYDSEAKKAELSAQVRLRRARRRSKAPVASEAAIAAGEDLRSGVWGRLPGDQFWELRVRNSFLEVRAARSPSPAARLVRSNSF